MLKKLLRWLGVQVVFAVIILTALTAALLVGAWVTGLTPCAIRSGAMEPSLSAGDLAFVRRIAPQDVRVGQSLTFRSQEAQVPVTRWVADIVVCTVALEPAMEDEKTPRTGRDGRAIFRTVNRDVPVYYFKVFGEGEDLISVREEDVIGAPVYALPLLGYLWMLLETAAGRVMAVCACVLVAALLVLPDKPRRASRRRTEVDELVFDAHAAKGDDLVVKARGAREGEDVLIEEE